MTTPVDLSAKGIRSGRGLAITAAAAVGVAAVVVAFVVTGSDDSSTTTPTATLAPTTTLSTAVDPSTLAAGEVLLEPVNIPAVHPFSTSVSIGVEAAPTVSLPPLSLPSTSSSLAPAQVPLAQVVGSQPGLYGGTRDMSACDKDQLVSFLESNPDKAAAWAAIQGIDTPAIRSFVEALTPVVLTRDTRVTNHGFRDGAVFAHPSVLQAGHAVLVDDVGVPRAKCSCGNPLLPPQPLSVAPTYVGTRWPSFDATSIVVVVTGQKVAGSIIIVDLGNGDLVSRPLGFTTGQSDAPYTPASDPVDLVVVGNIGGVTPGASLAASFTVDAPTLVTSIASYHYGPESPPGQVGLTAEDGTFFGPWQTIGSEGQGGVRNATWTAEPMVVVPAGTYTVWDSEPSTWSTNDEAGGVGFTTVRGIVGVTDSPAVGSVPTTTAGSIVATSLPEEPVGARGAAQTILDLLLLDCGYDATGWIDGGGSDSAWTWTVTTSEGTGTFIVFDPLGSFSVGVDDEVAAELAVECGFYAP